MFGEGVPGEREQDPMGLPRTDLPAMSSTCVVQKNFSQRRNIIREVRKCRSREKRTGQNNSSFVSESQGPLVPPRGL